MSLTLSCHSLLCFFSHSGACEITSYNVFCSIFSDGRLHAMEAFNQAYEEITGANFFKVSDSINCYVKNRDS